MKSDVRALRPEYWRGFVDMSALSEAQDAEINELCGKTAEAFDNAFIETCGEEGLSRREALFGILPDREKETAQFRRQRLLARYGFLPPYTAESLRERLEEIFRGEAFSISVDHGRYHISVDGFYSDRKIIDAVMEAVRRIIPCNMAFSMKRKDNTYAGLSGKTHSELSAFEQDRLLGEIIG